MGKCVMFTMRGCFRSITNYPFLVFLLCVLIFMYMSSPFMLSMVVSASPVLVCAAVLLGTLLFYGKPNIPKMEVDEKTSNGAVPIKSDLLKDADVGENRNDDVGLSKVEETESEKENVEVLEGNRGLDDGIEKQKDEWSYERFAKVNGVESEYEKSEAESWKREGDGDDDCLDSESDQPESSSPNESMADMMPMLDELHPLLNEDSSQLLQMSRVCSEAPSEQSPRTSISSSVESVEDNTNQNDGNKGRGNEADQEKAAIIWTEEDQKNLMDLGSSEIERNKRLENLLMRRMRRNTSMLPEINLIDLESCDFPFHISHISTTRQNPFDLPHDPYLDLGLPPIPSSAPPVLLPRRNPFDIPYEPSEANPYHRFQEELKTSESREAFFKRHENFSVGPSVFAPKNQDLKWGSFFIPEQIALELGSVERTDTEQSHDVEQRHNSFSTSHTVSLKPVISGQTRVKSVTNESVDDILPNYDPVYDSSPNAVKTDSSPSSISSDSLMDNGETVESPNSEDDFVEANEKLISTPSAGGIKPHFHDRLLHQHLEEVQVPNTPVESCEEVRSIQNIYISELHEFDTHEEPDEIIETNKGKLSELDSANSVEVNKNELKLPPKGSSCLTRESSPTKTEENTKVISVNRRFSTPF